MTLEQLCNCNADELEKLSDDELTKVLSPYFTVTRPELVPREKKQPANDAMKQLMLDPKKRAAFALLAEDGVELDFLLKNRKRKYDNR